MRPRALALAMAAAIGGAALAWLPMPAAADAPIATGWWQVLRQTTPVGALPAPPVPNDGSLPVQNGPAGALAFSAVRYVVGSSSAGALTLALTAPAPTAPAIQLCPTTAPWSDGADQGWDTRPTFSCAAHATGVVNGTTVTWTFGPSLLRDGELNAVIVPDAADPTPYAVSFAKPTAASLHVTSDQQGPQSLPAPAPGGAAPQSAAASTPAPPAGIDAAPVPAGNVPVVATPTSNGAQSAPQSITAADQHPLGSRSLAAALLAATAVVILLRGLGLGGAGARPGRSLLRRAPADDHLSAE